MAAARVYRTVVSSKRDRSYMSQVEAYFLNLLERDRSFMNQVQAHFLNLLEHDRSFMNQVQAHFLKSFFKGSCKIQSKDKPSVS